MVVLITAHIGHRIGCLSLLCLLSLSGVCAAQTAFSARARRGSGEVLCGAQVVVRFRTPPDKCLRRAQVVARRLNEAVLRSARDHTKFLALLRLGELPLQVALQPCEVILQGPGASDARAENLRLHR
ncbi:MAG: hypothetical protein RMK49_11960, partial [Abditibacteriales bacterium]|nr:hypothetical protein [Abditibacteriales bacterium]